MTSLLRPALPLAAVVAVVLGVPDAGGLTTTYGAGSDVALALALAAALALSLASAEAAPAGWLALAWIAPFFVGWETGPPLVRSIAMLAPPFVAALLLALARPPHAVAAAGWTAAGLAAAGLALFRDPFADPDCWSNCTENVFLAHDAPRAVELAIAIGMAVAVAALVAAARGPRRDLPLLAPVALAAALEAAFAAALLLEAPESPRRAGFMALYIARSAALIAVAAGIGWLGLRARRTRALVARLGREHSVGLRDVLARALGDPGVRVAFAHAGGWVDATGAPVALDGGVTRIERGGEPVAVVMHDASPLDAAALAREIGAAARLSVDNERLEAEVRAQVAGLRSSRAEIVETGDAARRTLERDLHDGAQQQLLALLYELRLAGLPEAAAEAQAALEDLRRLAHGIYPAILGEAGLRAALQSAAEESEIPVELGRIEPGRLSAAVETAAYLVAVAGIEASTTHAVIDASRRDGVLVVSVMGDVHEAPGQLADRVGALGGTLRAIEGTLEAAIPCA